MVDLSKIVLRQILVDWLWREVISAGSPETLQHCVDSSLLLLQLTSISAGSFLEKLRETSQVSDCIHTPLMHELYM
jgi:hypothetical protein